MIKHGHKKFNFLLFGQGGGERVGNGGLVGPGLGLQQNICSEWLCLNVCF